MMNEKRFAGSPQSQRYFQRLRFTRYLFISLETLLLCIILVIDFRGFRCFILPAEAFRPTTCSTYSSVRNAVSPDTFSVDPDGFCQSTRLPDCGTAQSLRNCTNNLASANITAGNATLSRAQLAAAYENLFGVDQVFRTALGKWRTRLSTRNVVFAKLLATAVIVMLMLMARKMSVGNPVRRWLKWMSCAGCLGTALLSGLLLRWGRGFRPIACSDVFAGNGSKSQLNRSDCNHLGDACGLSFINIFPSRNAFRIPAGMVAFCSLVILISIVAQRCVLWIAKKRLTEMNLNNNANEVGLGLGKDEVEEGDDTPVAWEASASQRRISRDAKILDPVGGMEFVSKN